MEREILLFLDYAGVFVFALSGALAASRKKMDIFGYVVIGMLPAVGGGTLRDLILNVKVFWVEDPTYVVIAVAASVMTYIFPVRIGQRMTALRWLDAMGLALFCVLGAAKGWDVTNGGVVVSVFMGVMTAVAGGIMRDVVTIEVPLVLQREIYATAAFTGAAAYCVMAGLGHDELVALAAGAVSAFAIRAMALVFGLTMPQR